MKNGILLLCLSLICLSCCQTLTSKVDDQDETVTVTSVDAVLSRSATLACDIEPYIREDRVYMVLWYRDGHTKPIYSFDVRGRAFNKALQWSDPNMFGPRAYFVTVSKPAALTLDGVQLDDEGIYRCRVDFKTSPTRNFAINLTVIVPPHQLLLYDNSGRDVSTVIGPLDEGSDLILTCEVRGGRPSPTVTWFVNDRMVEGQVEAIGNHVMVNRLEVKEITRDKLNSTFKCQASNTKLMMPSEKTVRLELLLRPLSAIIPIKPTQLVANEEITIHCEVLGSRPKAVISWTRDNRPFRRGKFLEEGTNETQVLNSVTFAPVPEDDGTLLKCIGENPKLSGLSQEDSFKLNVVYPPQVILHLGSTLNSEDIKEGDDVYFECNIKANPKQNKITWYHDGMLVSQNMSSGVIISTHSLVLQSVTRWQSGTYTCLAVNPKGETMSQPVNLRVRYAPVCSKDTEVTIIGASLDEILKVRCQVSADPSDVTFFWQFNNSGEGFDGQQPRFSFTSKENISTLTYSPSNQKDYGTLTCWGTNSIGKQEDPCIFQIVPASKPSPLINCTIKSINNKTIDIVEVECKAGYDGGLPQKFILEAFDTHNMKLRINRTVSDTENPLFHLDLGELLPSPSSLRIFVYASNAKGKSEKLILDDIMLNGVERQTEGNTSLSLVPLAGLLTGSLLTLGIAVLIIVVIAVRKKRQCDGTEHCPHHITLDVPKPNNKSRQDSMLEINTGDNRYVVAYTLKPAADFSPVYYSQDNLSLSSDAKRQPDILNTPRGGDSNRTPDLPKPNDLFNPASELPVSPTTYSNLQSTLNCDISNTLGRSMTRPHDTSFGSFTTIRREHIISDTIPGPESCV